MKYLGLFLCPGCGWVRRKWGRSGKGGELGVCCRLHVVPWLHLENPRVPLTSTGSLRQWFSYFSSLQKDILTFWWSKSTIIFLRRKACLKIFSFYLPRWPVNWTLTLVSWVEINFPSKSHSFLHCPLASSDVFRHLGLSEFNLWEILLNYFVHRFSPFVFRIPVIQKLALRTQCSL